MTHFGRVLPLAIWACGIATVAHAAATSSRSIHAIRVTQPPVIDGHVDEITWQEIEPSTDFIQQQPEEGAPSSERTEVRVGYDRQHLYIAVVCFDREPDKIVVTQSRRDGDLEDSDSIQVLLDTFNDNQNGFLFGTNPTGLQYDGQVAGEGRTGGAFGGGGTTFGGGGAQRGGVQGFNRNWDGDWVVRTSVTARGWEAEFSIPLKTLRYNGGGDQTWGINVLRNIRRRNEQSFLAPIPRADDIFRVSLAAQLTGLELPSRRDLRAIPFVVGGFDTNFEVPDDQTKGLHDIGLDVKWGVTPNLTADFTVNTDFAQVEADEEQVNLTRFDLFFPEKRPFFLENAQIFQFGQPQQIDLFFSRRIGLSESGAPIGILAGGRLSGRVGDYNVGLLNMQTDQAFDGPTSELIAPANNFTVARVQRQVGRSNFGGMFVNRQATGVHAQAGDHNRAYGLDANLQVSQNGKLFTFLAGSSTPELGSGYAGRALYDYVGSLWQVRAGYTEVSDRFNAEVGFVPRVAYRKPEFRVEFTPQPRSLPWIRRFAPHVYLDRYYGMDGRLQTAYLHSDFLVELANGGRVGFRLDRKSDRPDDPFTIYEDRRGKQVVLAPRLYTWNEWLGTFHSDPSRMVFISAEGGAGSFYDGHFNRVSLDSGIRAGATFLAAIGYIRNNVSLPGGDFSTDLVRVKATYSFSTNVSLQALVQYNSQSELSSSNIRFAWLNRSGTGLFVVFNERRDMFVSGTEPLGRSFVVKYTRLIDF